MTSFIPKGQLSLRQALDLVGRTEHGAHWRGADKYEDAWDQTVTAGLPNPQEARRKAEEDFAPYRSIGTRLFQLLYGTPPYREDAVKASMTAQNGRMVKIDADIWGQDGPLRFLHTCRVRTTLQMGSASWSRSRGPAEGEIFEGPILVSEDDLKRELLPAGGDGIEQEAQLPATPKPDASPQARAIDDPAPTDRSAGAYSPLKLRDWYTGEWVPAHQSNGRPPSRDEDWAGAKAKFGPNVPRDAVRNLRRDTAPPGWQRQGRRSKIDN